MKISTGYVRLNQELHAKGHYGISGARWAPTVRNICKAYQTMDVLDYGCGQRTLESKLGFPIRNYDPCIPGLDEPPEPAKIVVCTDVLEHVEPACLDDVLNDLRRVTSEVGFFVVATRPAEKTLPDGRNAHLIQEPESWWVPRFQERFQVMEVRPLSGGEFAVVVRPLAAADAGGSA